MQVGQEVMVRDPWIDAKYKVPPAKIISIQEDQLFGKVYLIEFINGNQGYFVSFQLKTI